LAIGKVKEKHYQQAVNEYLKRLSPYAKINVQELKAESFNESNKLRAKEIEAERILSYIKKFEESCIIVLDENGEQLSSKDFAKKLEKINKQVIFIIGGSLGLSNKILENRNKIALSKMTLPHELARVVLVEQLYRAVTIVKNKEYHY